MLDIGTKVSWCINRVKMCGVVIEDNGTQVKVMSHFRDEVPHIQQIKVNKELLTLIK